jgi:ribosome hibernation promoting factor
MTIVIKGRHWKPSAEYRAYATERIEKLERYFSNLMTAELTVTQERYRYLAEVRLLGNGVRLMGRAQDSDPRVGLDAVLSKLETALKRKKERFKDRKKRGTGIRAEAPAAPASRSREEGDVPIVRVRPRRRMLSAAAAARALLKGRSPVLVFTEAEGEGEALRVAYRMDDGQVGLLELD